MTRHLLDVASYQGDLPPTSLKGAGFTAVNLKISHGVGLKSVHPQLGQWVAAAKGLGLGISTFHYFTAEASGVAQADHAYGRLKALGLLDGTAHQLDVECEPAPTLAEVRAYITRMQQLLGRPIVVYTGDWWWAPKKWDVSDLTRFAWSAPNAGYLNSYPGDTSPHWRAGYGGWPELAIMQYSVSALGTTGIKVSKSAIRDDSVWTALTTKAAIAAGKADTVSAWTVIPSLLALRDEFNQLNPQRDKGADGTIGDTAHTSSSDHTPDEDSSILRDHDADSKNEVHALDIDSTGPWPRSFDSIIQGIVTRERARWLDVNDKCRLKYVIWDRKIASQGSDFLWVAYAGADPHTNHAHFSGRYETVCENDTRPWGVATAAAPKPPQEDDMPSAEEIADAFMAKLKAQAGKDALYAGVNQDKVQAYTTDPATGVQTVRTPTASDNGFMTWASALAFGVRNGDFARVSITSLHRKVEALMDAVELLAKTVASGETADAADRDAVLAALAAAKAEILAEIAEPPTGA